MKAARVNAVLAVRALLTGPRILGLVLLSGCAVVGTDYVTPAVDVPARFVGTESSALQDVAADAWWQGYSDATLDRLVARGLAANIDIAEAKSRVAAAEAALRGTGLAGQVDGNQSQRITRSGGEDAPTDSANSVRLSGSYVFDLFGGVRRGQERAVASRDAAILDTATTRLSVQSALVGRYIDARYYQEALALSRDTISSRERTLDLVRAQFRAGLATEIDVIRAQSDLDSARAESPALRQGFEASVFALATLLAEPAEPLMRQLETGAA